MTMPRYKVWTNRLFLPYFRLLQARPVLKWRLAWFALVSLCLTAAFAVLLHNPTFAPTFVYTLLSLTLAASIGAACYETIPSVWPGCWWSEPVTKLAFVPNYVAAALLAIVLIPVYQLSWRPALSRFILQSSIEAKVS